MYPKVLPLSTFQVAPRHARTLRREFAVVGGTAYAGTNIFKALHGCLFATYFETRFLNTRNTLLKS